MILSRAFCASTLTACAALVGPSVHAQTAPTTYPYPYPTPAPTRPIGFVVPEWKSEDGNIIIRARGRAVHDFFRLERDFDGGTINGETQNDDLRALRFGIDGQLSPKIRIRADANLVQSQINWVDVYIGYVGLKREVFVGQSRLASPISSSSSDINFAMPEFAMATVAFGQDVRNFNVMGRVKGANWQVVGALTQGNLNAGDIFGDDALRAAQIRATYAARNKDRDVLHVGMSLRARDVQSGELLRYRSRPAEINFGPRTIDSGAIAKRDQTLALEAMYQKGSLLVMSEVQQVWADTAQGTASLGGGYVEATYWLTGENRRYSAGAGTVGIVRPKKSLRQGGPGAIALFASAEYLDLNDRVLGSRAGRAEAISAGVSWTPVDFIMLRIAGSQNWYSGPNPARNGEASVIMGRVQFSF
jgi:phosphate-selective porin OprO and OprP